MPRRAKILVEKQIIGFYPYAFVEEESEINIFENRSVVRGEALHLKKSFEIPIRTYSKLETDGMNAILSALGKSSSTESSAIQILLAPVEDEWQEKIKKKLKKLEKGKK